MNASDPLDGKIRQGLAELMSRAPLPREFEGLTPRPDRGRHAALLAAAAVVVGGVAVGALALGAREDTGVSVGTTDDGVGDYSASTALCVAQVRTFAKSDADLIVYLQPEVTADERQSVLEAIEAEPAVQSFRFVDQDKVYEEFSELFAEQPELVDSVTRDVLPSRVELQVASADRMSVVVAAIDGAPGVREVIHAGDPVVNQERSCDQPNTTDEEAIAATTTTTDNSAHEHEQERAELAARARADRQTYAPPTEPTLSVTPSSGLVNGQVVAVLAEGLPPGEVIDIAACTPWDPSSPTAPACLHTSTGSGTVDALGRLWIPDYRLAASEPAIGFDCAEPPGCELAWYQGRGMPPAVATPIEVTR